MIWGGTRKESKTLATSKMLADLFFSSQFESFPKQVIELL